MSGFGSGKVIRLSLGVLLGMSAADVAQSSAQAEIRAGKGKGFKTKVNGRKGGRCDSGVCRISGGKKAGRNKFLKFKDFDTRGAIKKVEFDTGGKRNLFVGVTSRNGSFINKSLKMSSKANVFWLSPGGIHLGAGADFINVPKLNLATSSSIKFGNGIFDVFNSHAHDVERLTANPLKGSLGLSEGQNITEVLNDLTGENGTVPGIQMDGIDIQIDRQLFADALNGELTVRNSNISIGGVDEPSGRITLTGDEVVVGEGTHLRAEQSQWRWND